ncbi:hypothetical protein ACIGZJ_27240 [Kitasatospora sp. NPDC052868]|uniref:hypothetical protein n=1 Tax=Kitasatospora sp. NPDC052868 TaxID=3364060 RepID=UPI0037C74619
MTEQRTSEVSFRSFSPHSPDRSFQEAAVRREHGEVVGEGLARASDDSDALADEEAVQGGSGLALVGKPPR